MRLVASNQYAALALLVYDMLLRFDHDRGFIWGTNFRSTPIQWTFLFIRYFSLVANITIVLLRYTIDDPLDLASYGLCVGFFVLQAMAGQLMLIAVHLVLMSRVRMLYAKRRYIVDALFAFLLLAEAASMTRACAVTLPKIHFGPHCVALTTEIDIVAYGVVMVALQSTIISLTLFKYWQTTQEVRYSVAILSRLMRDGTWAFVVIVTCQIMIMVYVSRYGTSGYTLTQIWLITLLSCVGCRLIVNLHELGRADILDAESIPLGTITRPEPLYVVDSRDERLPTHYFWIGAFRVTAAVSSPRHISVRNCHHSKMDRAAHDPEAPSHAFMRLLASNQYAALALLVYDMLLRFDTELNFVWGTNFRSTPIQWTFLFIRYFSLAANTTIVLLRYTIDDPLNLGSYGLCAGFFVLQAMAGQLMLIAVHLVLMSRVRMLYAKRRYIVDALFAFLLLAEAATMIRACVVTLPYIQFGPHCVALSPEIDIVAYGVVMVALQSTIISLTLLKYWQTTHQVRRNIAILSRLMRDGTWAFVVIVTCQIMIMVFVSRYGTAGFTLMQTWLITLLSCVGRRLIVNLHELGRGDILDTESIPLEDITRPERLYMMDSRDESGSLAHHWWIGGA
ncbi:hypothetical protein FIBSPDRAFT_1047017 [Athelia psychrophila]|uniref:DUF6533 domain-containing protein n=1 Tax=Athelia psychrophila TaxID=1759441 RepID=A0A166FVA2_9AGAM|nr:hypothetical protein FIBSPDRAFT_1047017 [Fibularhizoctonia sp. CBS 109695]